MHRLGREVNREIVLTVLYDLALTISSEVELVPLLDKTLRRFLYHTGFPAGVVVEKEVGEVNANTARLITANGNYALSALLGATVVLPGALFGEKVELLDKVELGVLNLDQSYTYCLRLPVGDVFTIFLLSPREPVVELPLTHIFQPVLANLAKAVALCRKSDELRASLAQERDQALSEIDRDRSFLNALYETLPDLVWLKDPEGVYLSCNASYGRLYGAKVSEIIGKTDYDFVSRELADFFRQKDMVAASSGASSSNEETLTFADNGYIGRFHTIKTPMRDAEGRFVGVLGVARDISENHNLLEALRQSEAELKQERALLEQRVIERTNQLARASAHLEQTQFAMDGAGIALHWVDAESGRLLLANHHAARMLGYSDEEFLNLSVTDIDPNFPSDNFREATEAFRQQKVARFDTVNRHRNGQLIPVTLTIYFVPANSKDPARFISFIVDISARKAAEIAMERARLAAEQATQAKSIFLANMSHEIRTPMNAIIGMANLMRRAGVSPKQAEQLEKIDHAGLHLLDIINNVLDLSKIEAGKIVLEREQFTLTSILRSIGSVIGASATEKGLAFQVKVAGMPQHFCGDSTRLRQALLNFIGNAVKFTAQGSVMLAGRVMEEDQESYLLRFEVTDTGSGMTEAQQANLFKPFVQADGSITRKYGGTGLGLVISKNIAELMGGEVGVESHLGEGSTFWMTVRLEKGVEQAVEVIQQRSEAVELELRQKHAGARILLAEDEPINREVALELLRDVGMTACVAEDGREAVEYLERQVFDLVLMDMQMPNLDGLGATAKIRQLPNGLLVPIVAMTANAFSEDRQRCLAAGMNDFLTKPVDPDVLFATLLKWLASAPANASRESSVH